MTATIPDDAIYFVLFFVVSLVVVSVVILAWVVTSNQRWIDGVRRSVRETTMAVSDTANKKRG